MVMVKWRCKGVMSMKNKRMLGVIIVALGIGGLVVSVCHDYRIDLGPLSFLYHVFDWFSLSNLFQLLGNTMSMVMTFIARYFWMLAMIFVGFMLLKTKKDDFPEEIEVNYKKEKTNIRLTRNSDDVIIAGVCSGLAHFFGIDPTIIRIIALFFAITGGGKIFLVYFVLALVLPTEHLG